MAMATSSSTLVNVAEDAELRLARILADAAPVRPSFVEDCGRSIEERDAASLLKTIIQDDGAIQALFVLEPLDDAVSAFSLVVALLDRVKSDRPEEEAGLASALADAVVNAQVQMQDGNSLSSRRIALLSVLYNMRSDGREKCNLLARMVRLAAADEPILLTSGHAMGDLILEDTEATAVQPSVPSLVVLVDGWNVPVADQRHLYQAVAESIVDSPSRKQRFTLLLVETYTEASQVDTMGLQAIKEAVIGTIKDPVTLFVEQRSMLSVPAVEVLASNPDTMILHGLLTIFQEGKLDDFNAFLEKNGGESAVLTPYGLQAEQCIRYMRILSLCSLATEQEEIPYATVVETLQLSSEDEVESWVIAAVSSGLLSAKMDQLQRKVIVERSVVRKFDMEQWKGLQSRLNVWKRNIRGVLEGFKKGQLGAN